MSHCAFVSSFSNRPVLVLFTLFSLKELTYQTTADKVFVEIPKQQTEIFQEIQYLIFFNLLMP